MRLFIASSLPAAVVGAVEARASACRLRLPPASWVRSYHLTWAFLDEQPGTIVDPLATRLRTALSDIQPFEASVGAPGFFPSPKRPRVGWLAIEPKQRLQLVAERVRAAARGVGLELDAKEFTPHMTLVRVRRPWIPEDVESFLRSFGEFAGTPAPMNEVSVFESRLLPGGAQHTELRRIELGR